MICSWTYHFSKRKYNRLNMFYYHRAKTYYTGTKNQLHYVFTIISIKNTLINVFGPKYINYTYIYFIPRQFQNTELFIVLMLLHVLTQCPGMSKSDRIMIVQWETPKLYQNSLIKIVQYPIYTAFVVYRNYSCLAECVLTRSQNYANVKTVSKSTSRFV